MRPQRQGESNRRGGSSQQGRPYQRGRHNQQRTQHEKTDQQERSQQQSRTNQQERAHQQERSQQQSRTNQQERAYQQEKQRKQNKPKQKTITFAQLPKFITFNDNNTNIYSQFRFKWPMNKMFVVDFYPRAQVPVIYIDSSNKEKLEKHLNEFQQDIILIDIDWSYNSPLSIFEICSSNGVLLIHNSVKSDLIINFLKSNKLYTKGSEKVLRLTKYANTQKLNLIDIDEKWINPKRYPPSFDYLLRTFLGEPNYNFRPKSIRSSNFSNLELSCNQIMCCAYKVVSEFMLIPIVKSAPKVIGEVFKQPQKLIECVQMPFMFEKDKITKVTFIPDNEEEEKFILPMIEKLYDGKVFVVGSNDNDDDDDDIDELFGYGTSNGILITQKKITPFKHIKVPISNDAVNKKRTLKSFNWQLKFILQLHQN